MKFQKRFLTIFVEVLFVLFPYKFIMYNVMSYWVPSPPPKVLGEAEDGGGCGSLLRSTLPQRERGVIQGDPLSPTIFNGVVDSVVCHW